MIDLDLQPARPPVPRARRTRRWRVFFLIALLLTVGAAAPPGDPMVQVLAAGGTAAAGFELGPSELFTATFGQNPQNEAGVRRYDLSTGAQRWATPVPHIVQALTYDPQAGVVLARAGDDPRMTVLDASDGTALWHLSRGSTWALTVTGGHVLLRTDASATRSVLVLTDARTGKPVWRRDINPRTDVYDDAARDRIVLVELSGRVTTLRFTDGSELGQGEVGSYSTVDVAGDRLYVTTPAMLAAYRMPDLTLVWKVPSASAGIVNECGPVVCVSSELGVRGLDAADGELRWSLPQWRAASRRVDGAVVVQTSDGEPDFAEIDPATGTVLRRLGEVWSDPRLRMRLDTVIPRRIWVQLVDPADNSPHTVGAIDTDAAYGCEVSLPYLACPTAAGPTGVFRLPIA